MTRMQSGTVLIVCALVVLAWLAAPMTGSFDEPIWTIPQFNLMFDADRACATVRDYVTRYPQRVLGTVESRQSTGYFKQVLGELGYEVSYTQFDARIQNRGVVGRNVLAYKAGRSSETIAILAHYDTARTTSQGAMADGSGVAVMLELARIFSRADSNRGLLFVATDGTEWGQLGAADIVQSYPDARRIAAALSLDYVAAGELASFVLDTTGQSGGYSPPWLRELSRMAAESERLPVKGPGGFEEHLQRAVLISWTDQGPLLRAGIPAINLGSTSRDPARVRAVYHSAEDVFQNLNPASIGSYGRVAETIVRTLDGLQSVPVEPMGVFRYRGTVYLSPKAMTVLHYLTFLPLALALAFGLKNHAGSITFGLLQRELLAYVCTALPLLVLYYPIGLFRSIRLLPRFTLYPPGAKDPLLENPTWGVLWGIVSAGIVVAVALFFVVWFLRRKVPPGNFEVAKIILLVIFTIVILVALRYNTFWAVTFLFLPAWLWAGLGRGGGMESRLTRRIWIVAGGVVFYLWVIRFAENLFLGWKFAWYAVLALSTGLFTPTAYMLAAMTIALGLRFAAIQSHQSR
jgi:hypothetical protein